MVRQFTDLKCPHVDGTKDDPPRGAEWFFLLGDDHRLLLCDGCVNQIVGTILMSTVKKSIRDGARSALRIGKWPK